MSASPKPKSNSGRNRTPEGIEIRPATESDLDAVHRLEKSSFPAPWRREFFASELGASGRLSLVATRRSRLIGYVFAMWLFDEMHVNKIAVHERERRRGIAAALMDHCIRFARAHNIRTISLEVRESNAGAQDFYRQLRFEPTYVRARYYPDGESAVVMTRRVSG
jgi:ribosomal-protein-alanine N-acetyltransferase